MAAATMGVQLQAALLLCLVVLAVSPRVAVGNCLDECLAACNGAWRIMCEVSCRSACYGEVGITTLSTPDESSATAGAAPASSAAPAPQEAQEHA